MMFLVTTILTCQILTLIVLIDYIVFEDGIEQVAITTIAGAVVCALSFPLTWMVIWLGGMEESGTQIKAYLHHRFRFIFKIIESFKK